MADPIDQSPPPATKAPARSTDKALDLEELIAEYDRGTKPSGAAPPAEAEVAAEPRTTSSDPPPAAGTSTPPGAPDASTVEALVKWVVGMEDERSQAREKADASQVYDRAKKAVAEFDGLPADYAEAYINNRYMMDATFQAAWNGRHVSEAAMLRAERLVDRAIGEMVQVVKSRPDPEASADRAAVTAAVRGATFVAPPSKPVSYANKSDAEFNKDVEQRYGFRPL